jgi:hypothetical protein
LTQRRRLVPLLVAVPLLLAAGCTTVAAGHASPASGSTSAARTTTPESSSPTSAAPSPTDEADPMNADFPADTTDHGGPARTGSAADPAGQMHVSGIRVSSRNGYTRLVIDLTSHGVPAWTAKYTEASGPGGGPVDIQGDAFLRVAVQTGASSGNNGQSDIKLSPGPVAEARTTGSFEGSEEVLIGTRGGKVPFRAFALTDPGRIVIDLRSDG